MSPLRYFLSISLVAAAALFGPGCATARLKGPPPPPMPERVGPVTVIVEPFFESAGWKVTTEAQTALVSSPMGYPAGYGYGGYGMPQDITVYHQVAQKPVVARPEVLTQEQLAVLQQVQRLRPSWHVYSTAMVPALEGPVVLIRTVVGDLEASGSNRTLKQLSFWFGFLLPPLWIYDFWGPVEETQRIYGRLSRYDADAVALRSRLLRYPTQPDYAVDTRGLAAASQPFALDVPYEEGLFAPDTGRDPVVVQGFVQRLATAMVALVEGIR